MSPQANLASLEKTEAGQRNDQRKTVRNTQYTTKPERHDTSIVTTNPHGSNFPAAKTGAATQQMLP